jgi:hypothetical protein
MKLLSYTLVFGGLSSWFSISIGAGFGSAIVSSIAAIAVIFKQQVAFRIADNRNAPPFLSQFKSQFNTENLFLGDWKPELLTNIDEVIIKHLFFLSLKSASSWFFSIKLNHFTRLTTKDKL